MSTDIFERLLAAATEPDKAELKLAHNGRITAMKGYNDRPGKETKADYDAARALYQETIERLTQRYFPEEAPAPAEGEWFRTETEAYNYLLSLGYEVSRGKFNQDKKAGQLTVDSKRVSKFSVLQYGLRLKQAQRTQSGVNQVDLAAQREADEARKIKADADKSEMQAEEMRREQDRKWLHQDHAWEALAALVGALRDALRHQFHVGTAHIIHLAGGDPQRGPEVYEGAEELVGRAYNEVLAAGRIEGIFTTTEESPDHD